MTVWFRWQDDTLGLYLHLHPKVAKDEIVGPHDDALKIRITATATDGKANAHLVKFLASLFGMRRQQVELLSGDYFTSKTAFTMV